MHYLQHVMKGNKTRKRERERERERERGEGAGRERINFDIETSACHQTQIGT